MANSAVFQLPKLQLEENGLNQVSLWRDSEDGDRPLDKEPAPPGAHPTHETQYSRHTSPPGAFRTEKHEAYQN